jgi:hypothetical protein
MTMSEFVAPQIIYAYVDEFGHDGWTCCEDIDDARMRHQADMDTETHYAGAICVVIASDVYDGGSTGVPLLRALDDPETRLIDAVKAAL